MKLKIIVFIFSLTLIFYLYRITIEIRSKSVCFIMNYKSFLNYYSNENKDIDEFIDELLNYKVYNIYIYPAVVSDLVNEYNEIFSASGAELNLLFKTIRFHQKLYYLVIPKKLQYNIIKLKKFNKKFFYKDYLVYGFTGNKPYVNNISIDYIHKFEPVLARKKIHIIRLLNKPLLKNIDNFLIKVNLHYHLAGQPKKHDKIIKIHKFNKTLFQKEDIQKYIDENYRAVLERNVKCVMIHTLYYENKIVKLNNFLPGLIKKIKKSGYKITSIENINFKINNRILILYKFIFILLTFILLYYSFPVYRKYFGAGILFLMVLEIIKFSLFPVYYIILIFLYFYFINNFILRLHKEHDFNVKNLLLFTGATLLSGICISNFLFRYKSFFGRSEIIGVKISFLLPFIMWIVQYIKFRGYKFKKILKTKIDLLNYIIFSSAIFLIIFLLLRSGNYYLTVSTIELKLRQFLENVFFIRPRFKELLFYPFLLLLFFGRKSSVIKNNFFNIYFLALIAVATTINSFLHIHTLSYYSIIRSLTGMGIGFIIGGLVLIAAKIGGKAPVIKKR